MANSIQAPRASLLHLDRHLATDLPVEVGHRAYEELIVDVVAIPEGVWEPGLSTDPARHGIGLFVARGFLVQSVTLGHRSSVELLGPGDALRPWREDGQRPPFAAEERWRALDSTILAVLGPDATRRLCGYPPVVAQLMDRMARRARRQAGYQVISRIAAVEHRILLALWQMADEFGRVRPDGVYVPIPMTHDVFGGLIGARRPSVTAALGALAVRGLVDHRRGEGWLLRGEPPCEAELVRGGGWTARAIG